MSFLTQLVRQAKHRNDFNSKEILQSLYKEKANDIIIMDSNEMTDDWRKVIDKVNKNSEYDFTNMDDLIKNHEDTMEEQNDESSEHIGNNIECEDTEEIIEDELAEEISHKPKRVIAYSSKRLLQLFAKCKRGSVDGTFKSICKMWGQLFVWMLKRNSHWIPVVWGWLPDKSLISYKVR